MKMAIDEDGYQQRRLLIIGAMMPVDYVRKEILTQQERKL